MDTHLTALNGSALRPALKAIILALLPGLEEETSEDFERTLRLLNKFKEISTGVHAEKQNTNVDPRPQYFWQCLFQASITGANRRAGVLAYLHRYLPKLGESGSSEYAEDQAESTVSSKIEAVIDPEPGLLVRCFASGLADEQILIQRGFLDLLVTHFPIHSDVFQRALKIDDQTTLMGAAISVVTRREMSLNRRLWTWLLGPENDKEQPETPISPQAEWSAPVGDVVVSSKGSYFDAYSLPSLSKCLLEMIREDSPNPVERAKPFRIALSLMDRWEIGGQVVPKVFLPIMESVRDYRASAESKENFAEVLRSANVFFDGVESGLIWSELQELTSLPSDETVISQHSALTQLQLALFIISHFHVREEEMVTLHVPLVALLLLGRVKQWQLKQNDTNTPANSSIMSLVLELLQQMIDLTPERAYVAKASQGNTHDHVDPASKWNVVDSVGAFYNNIKNSLEVPFPLPPAELGNILLIESSELFLQALRSKDGSRFLRAKFQIFSSIFLKVSHHQAINSNGFFQLFRQALSSCSDAPLQHDSFPLVTTITQAAVLMLDTQQSDQSMSIEQFYELTPILVRCLWCFLTPSHPKYHVEAIQDLWRLQAVTWRDRVVEASLSELLAQSLSSSAAGTESVEAAKRFAIFWNHSTHGGDTTKERGQANNRKASLFGIPNQVEGDVALLERPLLLVLDGLSGGDEDTRTFLRSWLSTIPSTEQVLDILINRISDLESFEGISFADPGLLTAGDQPLLASDDMSLCLYYTQTLAAVFQTLPASTQVKVGSGVISPIERQTENEKTNEGGPLTYSKFLAKLNLFLLKQSIIYLEITAQDEVIRLRHTSLILLQQIFVGPCAFQVLSLRPCEFLITQLLGSIPSVDNHSIVSLMDTCLAAMKITYREQLEPKLPSTQKHTRSFSGLSLSIERTNGQSAPENFSPPSILLDCVIKGLGTARCRPILDSWVTFLGECLPLYSGTIFQILLPLVGCICREIESNFDTLHTLFMRDVPTSDEVTEGTLLALFQALEKVLAQAHDRLTTEELKAVVAKSPEQPQGFFGNMGLGVFTSEAQQTRSATANDRLSVLLCFKDAIRICFSVWAWGSFGGDSTKQDANSLASFRYVSLRMRNRAKRILEHLLVAEALESLEALIEIWTARSYAVEDMQPESVLNLLNVLDASKPKVTIPAIFNALYSRTNPSALDPTRKSTLTSDISQIQIAAFLVSYTKSLEDDVTDEIWPDCTAFLRDVLSNPFPQRQVLPRLLEFSAVLGLKMENTSFADQKKMRRELGVSS